jgi:hypothetical protein
MLSFKYYLNRYLIVAGIFIISTTFFSSIAFCSQVTDLVNVTKYHKAGFKGQNVKCAIVDNDFGGWKSLSYVKPEHAKTFNNDRDDPLPDIPGYGHGTSMATCFHEIAPEAEIYLADGALGLSNVMINYFKSQGILLVSESLNGENFYYNFLTGNDMLSSVLDSCCVNSSITVCTIAGNYANKSHFAHLIKDNSSNNMVFPNGTQKLDIVVSTDSIFNIRITRSGFQRGNANYTYRLLNNRTGLFSDKIKVGVSTAIFIPNDLAANIGDVLSLSIIKNGDTVDYLDIIIGEIDAGTFRLQNPEEMNKASSVSCPGASKKAITVGAILVYDYNKRDVISSVSGWGPIPEDVDESDNIVVPYTVKPELCGPSEAGATSPTAPRVAGCLAVLASAGLCDLSKPEETKQYLLANHIVKLPYPDKAMGYGRLFLDAATDWPPPQPSPIDPDDKDVLVCPNPISLRDYSYLKITNFSLDISKLEARIYNINGEFIKSFSILELVDDINKKTLRWDLRNESGDIVAPGIYFISIKTDSGETQIRKFAVQK